MANKLSLNVRKTKYSLFYKPSRIDELPFKLPNLSINNQEIKRASHAKFLGVILVHLKYTESIGLSNCKKH